MLLSAQSVPKTTGFLSALEGKRGRSGRIVVSFALAGGLSMEAIQAASILLGDPDHALATVLLSTPIFWFGAIAGLIHGVVLGVAAREPGSPRSSVVRPIQVALLVLIPALLLCWLGAIWISYTGIAIRVRQPGAALLALVGWIIFLGVSAWALEEARAALQKVAERWPERRPGLPLIIGTFIVLGISFVWARPPIWFTDIRPTAVSAVILAFGATIWIAMPILVVTLHLLRRLMGNSFFGGDSLQPTEDSR